MLEIRFDKTKDEVALLIWFLVGHSVLIMKVQNDSMEVSSGKRSVNLSACLRLGEDQ
jgi:hypothetical protein